MKTTQPPLTVVNRPLQPQIEEQPPTEFRILEGEGASDFILVAAAEAESDGDSLRRFTMTAYSGGKMSLPNFRFPVVVDLSGMKISAKNRPILRDHDLGRIVGHTEAIDINDSSIRLSGVISAANAHAQEVAASAENGFPWQASIGAQASKLALVDEGESTEVNGRKFSGPVYVAQQSVLREVSFVALGADDRTSARLAAGGDRSSSSNNESVLDMEFNQWLQGHGFDAEQLNDAQRQSLEALFVEAGSNENENPASQPLAHPISASEGSSVGIDSDPVAEMRARMAEERRRIAGVSALCCDQHPDIEARAIEEGWDETRTELELLRAARPTANAVGFAARSVDAKTLEAAACLSAGLSETEIIQAYGERSVEAAYPWRQIGLKELVVECARLEGRHVPRIFGDGKETIRAGFSTLSLPGILESVMTRTMLAAYRATPIAAFELCAIGSVSDFKEVSRYRLLGTGGFEQVAADGELKHGKLSEQKFTNKADTYGQILMLTRQDIINDDLNAFLDITRQMGRSGAESIDDLFFTLFLSNPGNFFSAGNNNYLTGAATAFSSTSLTDAKTLFRKQKAGPGSKAKDQKPINVRPELLVVPVELETEAELLMGSAQLMIDGSGSPTKIPVDNPHRNKYRIVSMPHLSDNYYSGASAQAWYLFADPQVLPAFELVFLNGRRTPVIERVEAPPNNLGMGFRGYIDVGVNAQEHRGAVKMAGQ